MTLRHVAIFGWGVTAGAYLAHATKGMLPPASTVARIGIEGALSVVGRAQSAWLDARGWLL